MRLGKKIHSIIFFNLIFKAENANVLCSLIRNRLIGAISEKAQSYELKKLIYIDIKWLIEYSSFFYQFYVSIFQRKKIIMIYFILFTYLEINRILW